MDTRNFVAGDGLDKTRTAWKKYQSTRRRGAIYDYLSEVFETVRRWKQQDVAKVHQALKAAGHQPAIRNLEPFGVVVFCTSNADTKTRRKWSKALRFAERSKPETEGLAKVMKRQGGINE